MKVDEMVWGMWHAWETNAYIVCWEHLKERDYLGSLCVDKHIMYKSDLEDRGQWGGWEGSFLTEYIWHEGKWQ
jgi:hypothetical protein